MKAGMRNAGCTALVYPVSERCLDSFTYYIREFAGSGVVRPLAPEDYAEDFCGRIERGKLVEKLRGFSAERVCGSLKPRLAKRVRADAGRLGIAALLWLSSGKRVSVPVEYLDVPEEGSLQNCVIRMPEDGPRYSVTDMAGDVCERLDAVQLRSRLMKLCAKDVRRFNAEVPSRCIIELANDAYVLLPETKGNKGMGRMCMHVPKACAGWYAHGDKVSMEIPYSMNVEVRSLACRTVYSMHGSMLCKLFFSGKYNYSDRLKAIALSVNGIEDSRGGLLRIRMPQTWRVLYKDCILTLPSTCLLRTLREQDTVAHIMLCTGLYTLEDEGTKHELTMQELSAGLDGNEYEVCPRVYLPVPYKAVSRERIDSTCIGLVLSGTEVARKPYFGFSDFSCYMVLDNRYVVDERNIGGKRWIAVPPWHKFAARVKGDALGEETEIELSVADAARLLGALQADYDSARRAPGRHLKADGEDPAPGAPAAADVPAGGVPGKSPGTGAGNAA